MAADAGGSEVVGPLSATADTAADAGEREVVGPLTFVPALTRYQVRSRPGSAISPDFGTLATWDAYAPVRFWDLASGSLRGQIETPRLHQLIFSPDSRLVAAVAARTGEPRAVHSIELRDAHTGEVRTIIPRTVSMDGVGVAFTPDSSTLVVPVDRGPLELWDVQTGQRRRTIADTERRSAFALSPDGTLAATGDDWGVVRVWDLATGAERPLLRPIQPQDPRIAARIMVGQIRHIAWHPRLLHLAAAGFDGLEIWNVSRGRLERRFRIPAHGAPVWSPDGARIAMLEARWIGRDETARVAVVNVATGRREWTSDYAGIEPAWSPDGATVALGSRVIHLVDAATGTVRAELRGGSHLAPHAARFSPDGGALVVVDDEPRADGRVFDVRTGTLRCELTTGTSFLGGGRVSGDGTWMFLDLQPEPGPGQTLARIDLGTLAVRWHVSTEMLGLHERFEWSADATRMLFPQLYEGRLLAWDVETGRRLDPLPMPSGLSTPWAVHAGSMAMSATRPPGVVFLDPSGQVQRTLAVGDGRWTKFAFTGDGALLVTAGRRSEVTVWDATSGARVRSVPFQPDPVELRASPSGARVAVGHWSRVLVFDAASGAQLQSVVLASHLERVAFRPDGGALAICTVKLPLQVHDLDSGAVHQGPPWAGCESLQWTPDGRVVVAVGPNRITLHRPRDGATVFLSLRRTAEQLEVLAFTPEGLFDGTPALFDLLGYRVGNDLLASTVLSGSRVAARYHRPGLVADLLAGRPIAPVQ
jgi:WD40 repeat protein